MPDMTTVMLAESRKAVDNAFAFWHERPHDLARLVSLKNAVDHLYEVERRITNEQHDRAFGGRAGR